MIVLTMIYTKEEEAVLLKKSKVSLQSADNTFQWNLIEGIYENNEERIHIINSLPIGSFPKNYKELIVKSGYYSTEKYIRYDLGFINIPILKDIIRFFALRKKLLKLSKGNDDPVLVYGLYLPQLLALKSLKKYENNKVVLVIDDLPGRYGLLGGNPVIARIKCLIDAVKLKIVGDSRIIDGFVLLTPNMTNVINLQNRKYCVVEGIAGDPKPITINNIMDGNNQKIMMYAGTLNREFGVPRLIDAMRYIQKTNYELWICGDGNARAEVEEAARIDARIKYFGYVSKSKADDLQTKATVLVNPRDDSGTYTQFSFPSKTIEYMLSSKPVVMYKLPGIPNEYNQYLYYVEGKGSAQELAKKLMDVCEMEDSERMCKANEAMKWVSCTKNKKAQAEKIICLINSI